MQTQTSTSEKTLQQVVYRLRVNVRLDQEFMESIESVGSGNKATSYDVRRAFDLFPPTRKGNVPMDIIVLNFPKGDGGFFEAIKWAEENGHDRTDPRVVCAIEAQHPEILTKLRAKKDASLVSTMECTDEGQRKVIYVYLSPEYNRVNLISVDKLKRETEHFLFVESVL